MTAQYPPWGTSNLTDRDCSHCHQRFETVAAAFEHEKQCPAGIDHRKRQRTQAEQFQQWAEQHPEQVR